MDRPDRDADLKAEIQAIYDEHEGRYGYRRIRDELANRGQKVNHKKVQRLLELELRDYVNWFNNIRIHQTLGYLTPAAFK